MCLKSQIYYVQCRRVPTKLFSCNTHTLSIAHLMRVHVELFLKSLHFTRITRLPTFEEINMSISGGKRLNRQKECDLANLT
jgi:hypothetical protein